MLDNGLTLNEINSIAKHIEDFNDLSDIDKYIKNKSFVVAYLYNEVLFGVYDNGIFEFYENKDININHLKRMRVFNKEEELYIWNSNGKLTGRYRNDTEGEKTDVVQVNQVILGTTYKYVNGYTILKEKIGSKITLPGSWIANEDKRRVAIKVRHYIEYLNGYQSSYYDSRFLEFVQLPIEGGK